MKNKTENNNNNDSKAVRERLLDAAEGFFSEKGFDSTSVRDLTATADSNIAAVNYYFGGKEKLYIEVFHRRMGAIRNIRVNSNCRTFVYGCNDIRTGRPGRCRLCCRRGNHGGEHDNDQYQRSVSGNGGFIQGHLQDHEARRS